MPEDYDPITGVVKRNDPAVNNTKDMINGYLSLSSADYNIFKNIQSIERDVEDTEDVVNDYLTRDINNKNQVEYMSTSKDTLKTEEPQRIEYVTLKDLFIDGHIDDIYEYLEKNKVKDEYLEYIIISNKNHKHFFNVIKYGGELSVRTFLLAVKWSRYEIVNFMALKFPYCICYNSFNNAIDNCDIPMLELLLNHEIVPNYVDLLDNTTDVQVKEFIFDNTEKINAIHDKRNEEKRIEEAIIKGEDTLVNKLVKSGIKYKRILMSCVMNRRKRILKRLLETDAWYNNDLEEALRVSLSEDMEDLVTPFLPKVRFNKSIYYVLAKSSQTEMMELIWRQTRVRISPTEYKRLCRVMNAKSKRCLAKLINSVRYDNKNEKYSLINYVEKNKYKKLIEIDVCSNYNDVIDMGTYFNSEGYNMSFVFTGDTFNVNTELYIHEKSNYTLIFTKKKLETLGKICMTKLEEKTQESQIHCYETISLNDD